MLRALGLSRGTVSEPPTRSPSSPSISLLDDAIALEEALHAMDMLMDDRIEDARKILSAGDSAFYKLARGVISFIEATLGFEPEAIKKATDDLYQTEESAIAGRNKAIKAGIKTSSYFLPGLEYAVVNAEAQLLGAIALLLSESMLDTAKALLKLRKAYQALSDVHGQMKAAAEKAGLTRLPAAAVSAPSLENQSLKHKASVVSISTASSSTSSSTGAAKQTNSKIFDNDEGILTMETLKHPEISQRARQYNQARLERYKVLNGSSQDNEKHLSDALANMELDHAHGKRAGQDAVDEYIVSAVNACYGILQLIISILPPSIGRVLSIVGFHGSKEDGIALLWKSVESVNIHGAIGLLALLQFYDGPTQVRDIHLPRDVSHGGSDKDPEEPLPDSDDILFSPAPDPDDLYTTKYRLRIALRRAAGHFSHGALWQLQEGRMEASRGNIREAIRIMDNTSRGPINMRQVEGLMLFDKTMFMVTIHGYEQAAQNFIRLIDLNTWSHMFYTYLSAVCHVEIYRQAQTDGNTEKASKHKQLAADAIERAPGFLGKRKLMSKPMPFDVFTLRKMNQWKQTAKQLDCHIVDAVSTSPIHEIIYFWSGFGRMLPSDLEIAMKQLGYSGEPGTPFAKSKVGESLPTNCCPETEDESLIRYLLQSITLRCQGKTKEGYELLLTQVLSKVVYETPSKGKYPSGLSKMQFFRKTRDPWLAPSAVYEAAVFEWVIGGAENVQRVRDYLDVANSYGDDFELSTRVGLKTKAALSKLEGVGK